MTSRPHQITDRHLRRRAVVYIRQSSPEQVRGNTGSTEVQRDLAHKVEAWGWPANMIDVLEGDLGISGATAGTREEFQHLLDRMEAGEIGLVAVVDISRLSRNIVELAYFMDRALRYDVLLAQNDQILDFNDPNSSFVGGIAGLNAIRDNRARTQLQVQARWKKARAGQAPTAPPVGYVRRPDGNWGKDPDPRVRNTITLIFDKAVELGSIRGTLRYLREHNVQVPRRHRRNHAQWVDATYPHVSGFLTNPGYAGTYVFGQTRLEPAAPGRRKGHQRPRPKSEWLVLDNLHEPYLDPARWAALREQIAAKRQAVRPPAGRGEALIQGLVICGTHRAKFQTRYSDRLPGADGTVRRPAGYICTPPPETAGSWRTHQVKASYVDAVLERHLLETLTPLALDGLHEAIRQELRQHQRLVRSRQDEIRRLQQAADEAERAYLDADRANTYFKKRLGEHADKALAELEALEMQHRLHPLVPPLALDEATLAELRDLLSDLPRLFRHPCVTTLQRKGVIRIAIAQICLTMTADDNWPLEIEWAGGMKSVVWVTAKDRVPERHPARRRVLRKRPIPISTYQFIRDHVELGIPAVDIADRLNEQGARHRDGPWNAQRINRATYRLRRGQVPGVEPLLRPLTLTDRVRALHSQGYSPAQMVTHLRSQDVTTRYQTVVTVSAVYAAMKRLRLHPHAVIMEERVCAELREWGADARPADIAARLNALGLTTMSGTPWTAPYVREKLRALRIPLLRRHSTLRPPPPIVPGTSTTPQAMS